MPESILLARSGDPTVSVDGAFMHSRYDPRSEAVRYAAAIQLPPETKIVICIEPGLGYLCEAIRLRRPEIRILSVHCSRFYSEFEKSTDRKDSDGTWFPGNGIELESFLENWIADSEAESVRMVDWKPAFAAYGKRITALASEIAGFLKRASANATTVAHFGKRWVRNAFSLASRTTYGLRIETGTSPVVVAASGPSLETAFPSIRAAQRTGTVFVIAVSSALRSLCEAGIRPDLAVATDGGGWASFHLHEAFRRSIPVAMALTAACPSALLSKPLFPLRDQSRWQAIACEIAGLESMATPQRGTVAATALDIALAISSGPIYAAGFDLGVDLGRTHARPNALDRVQEDSANRLRPALASAYPRFLNARYGGAFRVYEQWMAKRIGNSGRINSLFSRSEACKNLPQAADIQLEEPNRKPRLYAVEETIHEADRRRLIFDALRNAAEAELSAARQGCFVGNSLIGELAELLAPKEYAEALRSARTDTDSLQTKVRFAGIVEDALGRIY